MKSVIFVGSSLRDLKALPQSARREAGFQIANVQRGDDPDDWKPIKKHWSRYNGNSRPRKW